MGPITSSALSSRAPTCLACLRRLARPGVSPISLTQTRGKRLKAQGVVVRLLEDVPKFGRKHTIFRVQAGRMRNVWYPTGKAEYMTPGRFAELGLTREAIGERDPTYDVSAAEEVFAEEAAVLAAQIELEHVTPLRAHSLIDKLVPQTLSFARKPIHPPATGPALPGQAIFGSVSSMDVAHEVRRALDANADSEPDALRVMVDAAHVRFVGLGASEGASASASASATGVSAAGAGTSAADKVKALGRYEVEISLVGDVGDEDVRPVRRAVEVVPVESEA